MIEKLTPEQIEQQVVIAGGNPNAEEAAAVMATITNLILQNQNLGPRQLRSSGNGWNRSIDNLRREHNPRLRGWN